MASPVIELWCKSCGSIGSLEELRSAHPRALSCCPERAMLTLDTIWFQLPTTLRQRWWKETGYSKKMPSRELREAIKAHIETRAKIAKGE